MTNAQIALLQTLDQLGIKNETFNHVPVFTCDEALKIKGQLPPHGPIKNLFLKDKKKRYWLVSALYDTKIQLKELAKELGAPELRFAQPEELMHYLGVEPGSVTPLALINDAQHLVQVVLDKDMFDQKVIGIHPLLNSATTLLSPHDLEKFVTARGNSFRILDFKALRNQS